jgi:hypothetical protein
LSTLAGKRPLRSPDFVADLETQVSLLAKLQSAGANVLLDSTQPHAQRGRHSIIGFADAVQWFDSTRDGIKALERGHRLQARMAGRSISDLPFVGGLIFVGGGDAPFGLARVPTVAVLEVVSRALWLQSRLESLDDEHRTKAHLKATLDDAWPPLAPMVIAPSERMLVSPWTAHSRRESQGNFEGDPLQLFRVLRAAAARPFMGFMRDQHRAFFGAGAAPLLTIRSRLVTMWVPTGRESTIDSPEISTARETLRGVIRENGPIENVELGDSPDGVKLRGARFSGRLRDGRIVPDAIAAAMYAQGEGAAPVAGYLGWDGSVDTAVLEDSISLHDGRYRAVAHASGDNDGALEYAVRRAARVSQGGRTHAA